MKDILIRILGFVIVYIVVGAICCFFSDVYNMFVFLVIPFMVFGTTIVMLIGILGIGMLFFGKDIFEGEK